MVKQPEARWVEFDRDLELGRAEDLGWALGYVSWGDSDSPLAPDICASAELSLPLEQSWSVVFVACLVRGWLPVDDRASELIGEFLPHSESEEGRVILHLIASLEASSDPRLNLMPPISGSVWPRLDARASLSWALSSQADGLITIPDAVRNFARSAMSMPSDSQSKSPPIPKEHLPGFKSKSANALFTMFLALSYTTWGFRDSEDAEALLNHLKELLKQRPADHHLDPFQLAVIKEAETMQAGQFANIITNANQVFTTKSNVGKRAKQISLGRAQTS